MKVGLFTSGYQRNPLEHAFEDAKRFGYDYVELWGGRPHAYAPDLKNGDIKLLRDLIDKYEMPVLGYTPEMNAYPYNVMLGTEAMRKDSIEYTKLIAWIWLKKWAQNSLLFHSRMPDIWLPVRRFGTAHCFVCKS